MSQYLPVPDEMSLCGYVDLADYEDASSPPVADWRYVVTPVVALELIEESAIVRTLLLSGRWLDAVPTPDVVAVYARSREVAACRLHSGVAVERVTRWLARNTTAALDEGARPVMMSRADAEVFEETVALWAGMTPECIS